MSPEPATCSKCSSAKLFSSVGGVGPTGNSIVMGLTMFSSIPVTRHVCLDCGFIEERLDPANLEKLHKRLARRSQR